MDKQVNLYNEANAIDLKDNVYIKGKKSKPSPKFNPNDDIFKTGSQASKEYKDKNKQVTVYDVMTETGLKNKELVKEYQKVVDEVNDNPDYKDFSFEQKKSVISSVMTMGKPSPKKRPNKPTIKEISDFVDYVGSFYGKKSIYSRDYNGGFTVAQIEKAVDSYIKDSKTVWGGGDSMDRELLRDRYLDPDYLMNKSAPEKMSYQATKMKVVTDDDKIISDCKKALKDAGYTTTRRKTPSGTKQTRVKRSEKAIIKTKVDSLGKTFAKDVKNDKGNKEEILKTLESIKKFLTTFMVRIDQMAEFGELENLKKIEKLASKLK